MLTCLVILSSYLFLLNFLFLHFFYNYNFDVEAMYSIIMELLPRYTHAIMFLIVFFIITTVFLGFAVYYPYKKQDPIKKFLNATYVYFTKKF